MRYVIEVLREKEAREQLPVVKMEIDYELVTLHDALLADDKVGIIKAKEKLEQLRVQWANIINDSSYTTPKTQTNFDSMS